MTQALLEKERPMTSDDIYFLTNFIAESDAIEGITNDRDILAEEIAAGTKKRWTRNRHKDHLPQ